MISLGAVCGGPEETEATRQWKCVAHRLKLARVAYEDWPHVNVVFHYPGTLLTPRFAGARTAKFSRKQRIQMIQVAVPAAIAYSEDKRKIHEFYWQAISEAVRLAAGKFHRAGIPYVVDEYLAFAQRVRADLEAEQATGG